MIYKWKPATRIKTSATTAGAVFEELENTIGLTAQNLVEASREEDAPLHNEFEWNDSIAAEKYREDQARYLIRSITICQETNDEKTTPIIVRAFFQTTSEEYENIAVIFSDEEKKSALLERALMELEWFKTKYASLKDLDLIFNAIDKLEERYLNK